MKVVLNKFFILIAWSFLLNIFCGCQRSTNEFKPPPASQSLLFVTPYIGDEPSLRNPPPAPERMLFNLERESVIGWYSPPELKLRFPVELREGARLFFRLGVSTTVPIHIGDLVMRVEYLPLTMPKNQEIKPEGPVVIYQTTPEENPQCFGEWFDVDIPLSPWAPGNGELLFILDGPAAGNPEIKLMWGCPSIYHPAEMRKKNVLLIGVDTLRADSVSLYGGRAEVTPYLEEFSKRATTFLQARSQAPWTLPSFASMLTGQLPSAINSNVYTGHLPDKALTLGEILIKEGFATQIICSNAWIGQEQSGFEQGVEGLWYKYDMPAEETVDKAREFITRSIDRDWFCFLHFIDPHVPYRPPQHFVDLLTDPAYSGEFKKSFGSIEEWKAGEFIPDQNDIKQVRNLYDGEVAYLDSALVQLFKFLEENNLLENTLIIFSADHGEEFYDHGQFEHGQSQYDELVKTPLIIMGEGFPAGLHVEDSVGNIDIAPTILRYLNLPIPEIMIGFPLQDVISGKVKNRTIFGEDNTRGTAKKYAVEWPYKCILDLVTAQRLLFDLQSDPHELKDISSEKPEICDMLVQKILTNMKISQTAFHVWLTRSYKEPVQEFSGSILVTGGIKEIKGFLLDKDTDKYHIEGNLVTFNFKTTVSIIGPNKHLLIVPEDPYAPISVSIRVNGMIEPNRLFPYGTPTPEPSCEATVRLSDYPLGADLPLAIEEVPARIYLWGSIASDESQIKLDEQTREQLKSLGYVTD